MKKINIRYVSSMFDLLWNMPVESLLDAKKYNDFVEELSLFKQEYCSENRHQPNIDNAVKLRRDARNIKSIADSYFDIDILPEKFNKICRKVF